MNRKLNIMCDVDDTLWELVPNWINFYNAFSPKNDILDYASVNDWDIQKCLAPKDVEFFWSILGKEFFWEYLGSKQDKFTIAVNRGCLSILSQDSCNFNLSIVSATHTKNSTVKFKAFKELYPMIKDKDIITCDNKFLLNGDIYIDDNPDTIGMCDIHGKQGLLISQPWNQHIKESKYIHRCNDFKSAVNYIMENYC